MPLTQVSDLDEIEKGFGPSFEVGSGKPIIIMWYTNGMFRKKFEKMISRNPHVRFYEFNGELPKGFDENTVYVFRPDKKMETLSLEDSEEESSGTKYFAIAEYECGCTTTGFNVLLFLSEEDELKFDGIMGKYLGCMFHKIPLNTDDGRKFAESQGVDPNETSAKIENTAGLRDEKYVNDLKTELERTMVRDCVDKKGYYFPRSRTCAVPCDTNNPAEGYRFDETEQCRTIKEIRDTQKSQEVTPRYQEVIHRSQERSQKTKQSFMTGKVNSVTNMKQFNQMREEAGKKLVVVDFFGTWCGPCKIMSPIFESIAKSEKDVVFIKVDVEAAEDVSGSAAIKSMPTFIFYKNNREVERFSGADEQKLRQTIAKLKY